MKLLEGRLLRYSAPVLDAANFNPVSDLMKGMNSSDGKAQK
jgi:hypothetical protein